MIRRGSFWPMNLAVFLMTTLLSTSAQADLFELSLIHFNDFHARFVQTSPASGTCLVGYESECVGGIARLYTASTQLVSERPNAILLNAGDVFQGTLYYNVHGWNITETFMDMFPQDVSTIGNHEFDNRVAGLVPYLEMVNFPIVVTNIDDSDEPSLQGLWQNSTIIERNGTKMGVIGVVVSTMNTISSTGNLKFLDEVESVNAEAERLKAQGIDIIIVLSHCGLDVDRIMAAECPDVDIIVGGHTHSFLYTGTPPADDIPEDTYPVVVTQEDSERTVLIVQAYAFSKYLGNLTVWFNETGEVVDWEGNPILLDSSVEQDPDILAALAPWSVEVDALSTKEIGTTLVELYNDCRYRECNIGDLITDAMVDSWVDYAENSTYWTYAAIACTNAGGVRASIENTTGVITYGDAVLVQPFENTWDVIELQGYDLLELLEVSVMNSSSETEFIGENFIQWSGIKVTFNLSNEPYDRVTNLTIRCRACEEPVYEDIVLDEWYRIAVLSYLVTGGDGLTTFATNGRNHVVGTLDIDNFVRYIEKMSPITIEPDGRMTLEGTWSG